MEAAKREEHFHTQALMQATNFFAASYIHTDIRDCLGLVDAVLLALQRHVVVHILH